jgi:DNA polymerase V
MRWNNLVTKTVTAFVQTDRFNPRPYHYSNAYSYHSVYHSDVTSEIYKWVMVCLEKVFRPDLQFRRAGIVLGDLVSAETMSNRLFEQRDFERRHRLSKLIDEVNFRYGRDVVRFAVLKENGGWQGQSNHRGNDSYHAVGRDMLGLGKTFSKPVRFL